MLFAIGHLAWFLLSLAAGTAVATVAVVAAKQFAKPKTGTDSTSELVAA